MEVKKDRNMIQSIYTGAGQVFSVGYGYNEASESNAVIIAMAFHQSFMC